VSNEISEGINIKVQIEKNEKNSAFTQKEMIGMAALTVILMFLITIAAIPSLREKFKAALIPDGREILAKVSGNISAQGPHITVLKLKTKNALSLEVYDSTNKDEMLFLEKIPLEELRDGYVSIKGNATNLGLTDVDKDGNTEIVAPTFDDQMIPRLNVFKYIEATKSFERINSPNEGNGN
jgi:hypothetical protein